MLSCLCPHAYHVSYLKGFPKMLSGDSMTWSNYVPGKPSALPSKLSPRVNTKQTYLPFLRSIYLCVIKLLYVCPYVSMNVSSCYHACLLMPSCVCPHAFMGVSPCSHACVLIRLPLRSVSHNKAINELRNLALYPVNTQATATRPTYNNYVSVLYSYWVFYCEAEGYNKHHAMARQVLLYVFYARPEYKSMILLCV